MMNHIRVIPRLDIKGPNLVKGISFEGFRVLGTPDFLARTYYEEGADELIYYDTVASLYRRNNLADIVNRTAREIFIPLTVAGGLRSVEDIRRILHAGADKVAINTAAVANPDLIREAARKFGSQCIVVSIEAKRLLNGKYEAWVDYGRQPTGVDALDWARRVVELGAGEILVTSIDNEGTARGYDIELTAAISEWAPVPVIACGGAGCKDHVIEVVQKGHADAVSAAALFHYRYLPNIKTLYMSSDKAELRMGRHIDEGNIDFLKDRLSESISETRYQPDTIESVKEQMRGAGFFCRPHFVDGSPKEGVLQR